MTERDLIGEKVVSKFYGEGEIIDVFENKVEIQFAEKTSIFTCDSFAKSIIAKREEVQEYLLEKINTVVIGFRWGRAEQCVKTERVKKGQKFIFPPAPPAANKEGYQFVGWKYNEKIYVTGEEYKAEENVTFRDEWKKVLSRPPFDPCDVTNRKAPYRFDEIENKYGIRIKYFGRGINPTRDCIVLISRVKETSDYYVYHDHWTKEGDYIFSGEGRSGDQTATRGNWAILNSQNDCKPIYLFIKFSSSDYYYQGQFELVDYTIEDDNGEDHMIRKEYKFCLRKVE